MSYEKNNVVIVTVVSLIFIISSAIVYFVFFLDKPIKDDTKDSIYVKVTDETIIEELENTIKNNNLIELAKYEKTLDNINAISNIQKLNMAFGALDNEEIDNKLIVEYFKNSFKNSIYYSNEDIMCSCKEVLYTYDKESNTYKYNNHEHEITTIYPYYSKVLSVDKKNDTYVIKVAYVWNIYDIERYTNTGYASYNDALNKQNELFKIEVPDISANYNMPNNFDIEIGKDMYAVKEIKANYELYKNKLHRYTYTFEKDNDLYKLVSFKFEK